MRWSDIQWNPKQRLLWQFAGLWILFFASVGLLQFKAGRPLVGVAALGIAGVGLAGLIRPRIMRPLFVAWMVAAFPIGWCVSNVLLALIFYGVFTPMGIVCRLCGRDVLKMKKPETTSYLQPKESPPVDRYYRTF